VKSDKCGTITGYYGRKCKCDDCRAAARDYYHQYAAREPRAVCCVDGCERLCPPRGRMCSGHRRRLRVTGTTDGPPLRIPNNSSDAGYEAAHKRVLRERGKAREHSCSRCGVVAVDWAYIHGSPGERPPGIQRNGRQHGPYSLDPSHYEPMCKRCHRRYDIGRINAERKARALLGVI